MLRKHGDLQFFQESEFSDDSIPASPLALTPGIFPDRKFFQSYRVPQLQYLRIRDPGIGHMLVDRIGTIFSFRCSGASGNGLLIAKVFISEQEIVHGSLAAS